MASQSKHKKDVKTTLVRIVSLSLAVLMVLSVLLASIWR